MQHCSHGELIIVSCVLLHGWHLLHTVHGNSNFTYDNLVTIAAAVLSGPILGSTLDTAICHRGAVGLCVKLAILLAVGCTVPAMYIFIRSTYFLGYKAR